MKYQAIAFDLDGTVLNTISDLAIATNKALEAEGLAPIELNQYNQLVGSGLTMLIQRALAMQGISDPAQLEFYLPRLKISFNHHYSTNLFATTTIYGGISALLKQLKNQGFYLAIFTNKPYQFAKPLADHFFPELFDIVLGQTVDTEPKPAISYSQILASKSSIPLEQWIMVGDSDVDILTAQTANMAAIGVSYGFRGRQELERAGALNIADNAEEIAAIIRRLTCN